MPRRRDRPLRSISIEEIDAEDGLIGDLEHLQEEVHIALQAGRIRYDDRHVGA